MVCRAIGATPRKSNRKMARAKHADANVNITELISKVNGSKLNEYIILTASGPMIPINISFD